MAEGLTLGLSRLGTDPPTGDEAVAERETRSWFARSVGAPGVGAVPGAKRHPDVRPGGRLLDDEIGQHLRYAAVGFSSTPSSPCRRHAASRLRRVCRR